MYDISMTTIVNDFPFEPPVTINSMNTAGLDKFLTGANWGFKVPRT